MFRSPEQRKAMFANIFSQKNVHSFSVTPKHVDLLKKATLDISKDRDADYVRDYYLNELSDSISHRREGESRGDYLSRTNGAGMMTENEADVLVSNEIGDYDRSGVSLGSHAVDDVIEVESLDHYFDMNKDRIEKSGINNMYGEGINIAVDGDKVLDIRPDKNTKKRDLAKFSAVPVSKEVHDSFFGDNIKDNKLGEGIEDVLLYPGATKFNPITAFDKDYADFEKGRIFNSYKNKGKTVTDWTKFSSRPHCGEIQIG